MSRQDALRAIRDLEGLRQRCRINPDTGCWHWSLSMSGRLPMVHLIHPTSGRGVQLRGPRASQVLALGRDLPPGHRAWRHARCTADDCVNPGHCTSGDQAAYGAHVRASGLMRGLPRMRAANLHTARRRLAKLTLEQAREIRNAEGSEPEIAARYGVSRSRIGAIRRGEAWRDVLSGASAFALGGRP